MKKIIYIVCACVGSGLLVAGFLFRPDIFHVRFVPNETRDRIVTSDIQKALEHYYNEYGRYPVTTDETVLISTLTTAHYLPKGADVRPGEFTYEPINYGQSYLLK